MAYLVARPQKTAALGRVLDFEGPKSAIVFCRTRIEVDELTETLRAHGYGAEALHGGMEQKQRDRVMQLFRNEQAEMLVATDVAARGLDIDHVSHVINYDVPMSPEVYVHRIGRTGRIGREGMAITLAGPREHRFLRSVEGLTRQRIEILNLPSVDDLRARRLDATREAVRAQLEAGGFEPLRGVVESSCRSSTPSTSRPQLSTWSMKPAKKAFPSRQSPLGRPRKAPRKAGRGHSGPDPQAPAADPPEVPERAIDRLRVL